MSDSVKSAQYSIQNLCHWCKLRVRISKTLRRNTHSQTLASHSSVTLDLIKKQWFWFTFTNNNRNLMSCLVFQDQASFAVKNPKLDSNSALAKKRRAKAGGGAGPPTIQEQITQESMEVAK